MKEPLSRLWEKRPLWAVGYVDGPAVRIWWLGFFAVAKWLDEPCWKGWEVSFNGD